MHKYDSCFGKLEKTPQNSFGWLKFHDNIKKKIVVFTIWHSSVKSYFNVWHLKMYEIRIYHYTAESNRQSAEVTMSECCPKRPKKNMSVFWDAKQNWEKWFHIQKIKKLRINDQLPPHPHFFPDLFPATTPVWHFKKCSKERD